MAEGAASDGDISKLPESCIAHALYLTSPRDSCSSALVSATFSRAADSDTVWDRFLPPDHRDILSRAVHPPTFSSKKELYFRLCDPILIDGGKMSFELERSSGKKCFMISARQLLIVWGDTPRYWRWIPSSDSRFSEVAELLNVCWLEIRGMIDVSVLSPKTTYCAYLVFKIAERSNGLLYPAVASVKVGMYVSEHCVSLTFDWHSNDYMQHHGADDWLKLEMGEFFVDEGDEGEVDISLMETRGGHWKRGLIVQGIEIRPKM